MIFRTYLAKIFIIWASLFDSLSQLKTCRFVFDAQTKDCRSRPFNEDINLTKEEHSILKNGKFLPVINGNTKPITINVAGKNFGVFDKLFLQELPWWTKLIRVRQRILDPAILMVNWNSDKSLPPLSVCKERAGLNNHVTHNALEDAWDVIEVLRKTY